MKSSAVPEVRQGRSSLSQSDILDIAAIVSAANMDQIKQAVHQAVSSAQHHTRGQGANLSSGAMQVVSGAKTGLQKLGELFDASFTYQTR